jgi:hypothetical protein
MAVSALKTTAITLGDNTPPNAAELPPLITTAGRLNQSVGTLETLAADSIGSTYRVARIPSNARISSILLANDALTAGVVNVGLYEIAANGGALVNGTIFATGTSLASAAAYTNVYLPDIALVEKRVWELLGLAKDPGRAYDITLTVTTAVTAAGTISARVDFVQGN